PWAGTVKELFAEVGDTVNVGDNFFSIQVTQSADGDDEPVQAPLVGSGPKEDTAGRRRRRRRPQPEAPAEVESPVEPEPVEEAEPAPEPAPVQKSDLFTKV